MVISTSPVVVGNIPYADKEHLFEEVAFTGQAPVKIIGKVKAGDFIIPAGKNDGVGKAVSVDQITPDQLKTIIGHAWESSDNTGIKMINTAIGINRPELVIANLMETIASQNQKLENTNSRLSKLELALNKLNIGIEY